MLLPMRRCHSHMLRRGERGAFYQMGRWDPVIMQKLSGYSSGKVVCVVQHFSCLSPYSSFTDRCKEAQLHAELGSS